MGEGGAALLYGLQDDDGGGGSAEDEPRGSLVMLPSLLYGLYGLHGPGEELSGLQSQEGVVGDGDGGVSDGQSEVYGASITRRAGGHPIFLEDEWSRKSLGHWATSRRGWEDDDEEDEGSSGSSSGRWFFPREREEEEGTHKSVADVLRGVDFFPQESESAQSYRGAKAMGDRRSSDEAEGRGDDKRSFSSSDDRMSEEVPPPPIRAGYGSSAEGDTEDSPVENTAERATREQKLLKWLLEAETAAAAWKEPKEGEGAEHAEAGSKEGGGEGGELPDAMPTRLEVPPLDGRVADCQRSAPESVSFWRKGGRQERGHQEGEPGEMRRRGAEGQRRTVKQGQKGVGSQSESKIEKRLLGQMEAPSHPETVKAGGA